MSIRVAQKVTSLPAGSDRSECVCVRAGGGRLARAQLTAAVAERIGNKGDDGMFGENLWRNSLGE